MCRLLCGQGLRQASVSGFRIPVGGDVCRLLCVQRLSRCGVEARGLVHVSALSAVFVCARADCTAVEGGCRPPCRRWRSLTASHQLNAWHYETGNGAPSWRCRACLAGRVSNARRQFGCLSRRVGVGGIVGVTNKNYVLV